MSFKLYQKMLEAVVTEIAEQGNFTITKNAVYGTNKMGEELVSLFKVTNNNPEDVYFYSQFAADLKSLRSELVGQVFNILDIPTKENNPASIIVITGSNVTDDNIAEIYADLLLVMPGRKGRVILSSLNKLIDSGVSFNSFSKSKKAKK